MKTELTDGFTKPSPCLMTQVICGKQWTDDTWAFIGLMEEAIAAGGESYQAAIDAIAACKPVKMDSPKSYVERWEEATAGSVTPTVMFGFDYDKNENRLQQLANQFAAICPSADFVKAKEMMAVITR